MVGARVDTHQAIRDALASAAEGNFADQAAVLLDVLGYRSDRTLPGQTGDVDDFLEQFPATNPGTKSEARFREAAKSIQVLFQVTDEEILGADGNLTLFSDDEFQTGNLKSFLFAAVELCGDGYAKGRYAEFTREINKRLRMPAVVLFRAGSGALTLSFVHRRENLRDPDRDVLGSVSLIREIDAVCPHRAHLDILDELRLGERLGWMDQHGRPRNFDGLLAAWLDALDTEELNRRFYKDLFDWFERAVVSARFPTDQPRTLEPEEHVIRLITRLLFVWFIKEKRLIAEELFVENWVRRLLRDYDSAGDSYYRAILQNLFFATLNTEIGQREFSRRSSTTHRVFSRYRYKGEIADPDALLGLFAKTPFINGGLFDCLDSEAARGDDGYRIDCFTDNVIRKGSDEYEILSIPNWLFFGNEGLIDLFNRYKFTVEENTPAEQEVALDPELLGKVFENLLAANTEETRDTARRQTGSYYTPRPVVDYMVDEALVASLVGKVESASTESDWWEARLRYLLDYNDAFEDAAELFVEDESDEVIQAIAGLKVLDPAVGSGAFPMGVLNKLTLALRRLDPDNERWAELQKDLARRRAGDAFDTADQQERDAELTEISATFERYRDSDFGRKLYLIQNSIYGVDIQAVATQLAKLRFFISLAIEQQPDLTADNYGVKPLPNLETRFVAANALLGLDRPAQKSLGDSPVVNELKQKLNDNRERHFHATTRREKLKCRREDADLRKRLAEALRESDFPAVDAAKISGWDPYDLNASADWFDPVYMFGIEGGFDVVIGNPPYVQLQKNGGELGRKYQDAGYATFARTGDVYQLFYECGCQLLTPMVGLLAYITSNSWLKAEYGKKTRGYFAENHTPMSLLEMGKDVFENVIVDAGILLLREGRMAERPPDFDAVDTEKQQTKVFPPAPEVWGQIRADGDAPWSIMSAVEQSVLDKMRERGSPLNDWNVSINYGIKTGYNEAFIIDDAKRLELIAADPKSSDIIKPILRGRDIRRYRAAWAGKWLIATHNGYGEVPAVDVDDYPAVKEHLGSFYAHLQRRYDKGKSPYNLRNCAYYEDFSEEKLMWIELVEDGRFAYDSSRMYGEATTFIMTGTSLKYLCAVLNSTLAVWFLQQIAPTSGMGVFRWKKIYVEKIPVPKISAAEQEPFVLLVDRILEAKAADADTSELERQIDRLVYDLYGLTDEEDAAVEWSLGLIHRTDEAEDAAIGRAMEEAKSEGYVSEDVIMATLRASHGS